MEQSLLTFDGVLLSLPRTCENITLTSYWQRTRRSCGSVKDVQIALEPAMGLRAIRGDLVAGRLEVPIRDRVEDPTLLLP